MATKKFSQMTTKKLNALLATASDEDKKAIEAVLTAHEQATKPAVEEISIPTPDPVEDVLINEVSPEEKRSGKILYAIKTDDGRRIVKVHDSNLIRILDEVIEPEKKTRTRKAKDPADEVEWTPEAIAEEINEVIGNVGKTIELEKYRTTDENGKEHAEVIIGRIVAIVPDKRAKRLLYRISVPASVEGNPLATKTMHKVVKAEGIKIAEEFDKEGAQLNAKYTERREAAAARTPLTPQDRYIRCEENVKKAEEKLQKAQEELEAKKKQLEDAKKELDEYLASQAQESSAAGVSEEVNLLA